MGKLIFIIIYSNLAVFPNIFLKNLPTHVSLLFPCCGNVSSLALKLRKKQNGVTHTIKIKYKTTSKLQKSFSIALFKNQKWFTNAKNPPNKNCGFTGLMSGYTSSRLRNSSCINSENKMIGSPIPRTRGKMWSNMIPFIILSILCFAAYVCSSIYLIEQQRPAERPRSAERKRIIAIMLFRKISIMGACRLILKQDAFCFRNYDWTKIVLKVRGRE